MIDGLVVGLSILVLVAFPWFNESAAGVICSATQKIGKKFTKILNMGGHNNG